MKNLNIAIYEMHLKFFKTVPQNYFRYDTKLFPQTYSKKQEIISKLNDRFQ